jgi:hypothetical protein
MYTYCCMRVLRMLSIVISVLVFLHSSAVVKAAPSSNNNQLQVTARVRSAHHVIIDSEGNVIEILSNTTEDVIPKVYLEKISSETEQPLTDEIMQHYRKLVPLGKSKIGVLYRKSILDSSLKIESDLQAVIESPAAQTILAISTRL